MEKDDSATQQTRNYPIERMMPSSVGNGPQEEHASQPKEQNGSIQSMYCKDLVFGGDTEFSFEELRAQRYFIQLNEKVLHLNKVKQELRVQIEQKQKLIQGRNGATQHQQFEVPQPSSQIREVSCAPVPPTEVAPLKVFNEPEVSSNSAIRNGVVNQEENMGQGRSALKQRHSQMSKPFTVHDEKPNTRSFSMNHNSLKLPTSILKVRQPTSECPSDKDASISRSEEAIINGHWNKTLCRSPDDTCDFARAAQLASTPFGGPVRQNPSEGGLMEDREALNKTASVIFKEPNSDAIAETKKLSPIQEISQEWGYTSFAGTYSVEPKSQGRAATQSGNMEVSQSTSRTTESVPAPEPEMVNPCSLAVRKTLLDNVDLSAFTNFNRKTGPLPEANDDLHLDGETLLFVRKMGDADRYLYGSSGGSVLAKVDKSPVPWDFYISCQLRASLPTNLQHCYAESICYLYENGSFTLWRVHQGMTIQDLLEERIDRQEVPLLAVQLLEMVKQMHSCRLVHGALRPDTLMLCNSSEESVIIGIEFSSSLDLELQPEVKMVQALPSAQDYIKQGLLLPTASPYQVDLVGIAEIVHLLLVGRSINLVKEDAYWRLAEDCNLREPLGPLWEDFFHTILNPQDKSTECVLSNLINSLKNALYEDLE
ncbi:mitotic checkpoint serine/threonine-protein kinase BUB1 beta isoform X1 [Pygocentrus nattereri]|uniref:BUB1 mitotic checkpoint serine/threonine kinase Ba n=1 Tax=Pygocentrus nattereri TaxID=42514 RepID=A0A3B4EBU9_PYGNA|nr:mitotic checkpoint serine/threonine-protein kinase BUB1 beta isoform X1 [Pygocentrus nattereri]